MTPDAIVIGAGPNGLSAAIVLAREGYSVRVYESALQVGGGARSSELTLPGFVHDICSAIHPMAAASPFFQTIPWDQLGVEWIHPEIVVAHPLNDGTAAALFRSLEETSDHMNSDGAAYKKLVGPSAARSDVFFSQLLGPLRLPRNPLLMGKFALRGFLSAQQLCQRWFSEPATRGLFAGLAAHAVRPLDRSLTAAVGLMFAVAAHGRGWPLVRGGSGALTLALRQHLESLGGEVVTGTPISSLSEIPSARAILFNTSPRQLCRIAGSQLPDGYRRKLMQFRHGPGVFKVDWALSAPIPWTAPECRRAGTVHVGGEFHEVANAERAAWTDVAAERPFVLVAQQSLFDETRAPTGHHTGWAYCHVPPGSTCDMTEPIESQVERFAPGFRDTILQRHVMSPTALESYNANYLGGDISGGVMDVWQLFSRPTFRLRPYRTPVKHLFLCSASTPPGAGVHGMCGYYAAKTALGSALRSTMR